MNEIQNYKQLQAHLEFANPTCSFWGWRHVRVLEKEYSVSDLRRAYSQISDTDVQEKVLAVERLSLLARRVDEVVSERNYFTQLCAYLRSWFVDERESEWQRILTVTYLSLIELPSVAKAITLPILVKDLQKSYNMLLDTHKNDIPSILEASEWNKLLKDLNIIVENPEAGKLYDDVQKIWKQIFQLKGLRAGIFLSSISDDENSLFYSLQNALESADKITHTTAAPELRKMVVAWLRENLSENEELKKEIEKSIEAYTSLHRENLEMQLKSAKAAQKLHGLEVYEKVESIEKALKELENFDAEKYFNAMEQFGFFGSNAELYAISQIFNVNIRITRIYNGIELKLDYGVTYESNYPNTPWIHLRHVNGDHFDLINI